MLRGIFRFLPERKLLLIILATAALSLLTLWGLGGSGALARAALFFGFGFVLLIAIPHIFPWRVFRSGPVVIVLYLLSLALLAVPLLASSEVRGVRRWIFLGPLSIQPAELFTLALVILLAYYFASRFRHLKRPITLTGALLLVTPGVFLLLLQPDVSSALVALSIFAALALSSEPSPRALTVTFGLIVLGALLFGLFGLKEYQKVRIVAFLFPAQDPLGYGWQKSQALIAIGSGGIAGKGVGFGSQASLRFLPESETDFFFAAFTEAWGLLGVVLLLSLLVLILQRIIAVGMAREDNQVRFFALGLAVRIGATAILHIGSNVGLLPVAGLPLPFLSLGGSQLIASFIGLAILEAMRRQ